MSDETFDVGDESAFDAELVRRDDELLGAVGAPRDALSWDDDSDLEPAEQDAVLRLLRALRDDVDSAADDVAATVLALHGRGRRLTRRGIAVASVAAVVLSVGGVAAASVGAPPGSLLYPVRQLVTLHHAPNAGLVALGHLLDNAEQAIADGRLTAAHAQLDAAQRRADDIAANRLSASEQHTFARDRQRLADMRNTLSALEAAASATGSGKSGSAPGSGHSTGPKHPAHPTGPPTGPRNGLDKPRETGHAGDAPGRAPARPGPQPAVRGSSSAASRTPSANPRA